MTDRGHLYQKAITEPPDGRVAQVPERGYPQPQRVETHEIVGFLRSRKARSRLFCLGQHTLTSAATEIIDLRGRVH
jgi:hypothetical protein